jgi:hypothetical protein
MVHRRQRPGWVGLVVAALVAAGTQVVVQSLGAAPAAAAIGANLYTATSASNSEPVKSAVAHCPAGTRVFGGGAKILNGGGGVTLATMIPFHSASGDGYSVAATERPGSYLEDWSVQAYAICAPPISGLEIVMSATTGQRKSTFAACPNGKVVVGTGAAVGATRQGTFLYQVSPTQFSTHNVYVAADRTASSTAPPDFAVFAFAVCAFEPTGYDIVDRTEYADGDVSLITSSITCGGRIVLGTGAAFSSDLGFMTYMYNGLFVAHAQARKARQAPSEFWSLSIWAICAN